MSVAVEGQRQGLRHGRCAEGRLCEWQWQRQGHEWVCAVVGVVLGAMAGEATGEVRVAQGPRAGAGLGPWGGAESSPRSEQSMALAPPRGRGCWEGSVEGPGCASHMAWPANMQRCRGSHRPVNLKIGPQI